MFDLKNLKLHWAPNNSTYCLYVVERNVCQELYASLSYNVRRITISISVTWLNLVFVIERHVGKELYLYVKYNVRLMIIKMPIIVKWFNLLFVAEGDVFICKKEC